MKNLIICMALAGCGGNVTQPVQVMTLNAANGADETWRTPAMRQQQAAFIGRQSPDLLALQETDYKTVRVQRADVAAELTAQLPAGGTLIHGLAQEASPEDGGGWYGLALWVSPKHKVLSKEILVLPNDGSEVWPPYPPAIRVAILVRIRSADGREGLIAMSHLTAYGTNPVGLRAQQLDFLASYHPDVILGDLNCNGPVEAAGKLAPLRQLSPANGDDGNYVVDQVWAKDGAGWLLPTQGLSDHEYAAFGMF